MNDRESYLVRKERCPQCAKLGKDNSHDNMAVYSDGHTFCFGCSYTTFPNSINSFQDKTKQTNKKEKESIYLPIDCDMNYPTRCLNWINQYDLYRVDLLNHNVLWSESMQRLIFPVYAGGNLIAWQGRSFHLQNQAIAKIPKWFGKGNLRDTFNILGKGGRLCLVEDIISAIKLSKCNIMAMPLYGSFVGRERFKRLYNQLGNEVEVLVWLDPDKRKESTKESKLGVLCGLNCRTIFSDKDPKEIEYQSIKEILQGTQ